jgi:hypothetical protein
MPKQTQRANKAISASWMHVLLERRHWVAVTNAIRPMPVGWEGKGTLLRPKRCSPAWHIARPQNVTLLGPKALPHNEQPSEIGSMLLEVFR